MAIKTIKRIIWGIVFIMIPLLFLSFAEGKNIPFKKLLENFHETDENIIHFNIDYKSILSVKDTLSNDILKKISKFDTPLFICADSNKILMLLFSFSNGSKIIYIDTTGKLLESFEISDAVGYPQIINDSLLLCTKFGYNRIGLLLNSKGELLKNITFPFESRVAIVYKMIGEYIFTIGSQDISHPEDFDYDWTVGCYSKNSLQFIENMGGYPIKLHNYINEYVRVETGAPAHFVLKNNIIYGIFSHFPVFFIHNIKNNTEKLWKLKIDDFAIPYLAPNVAPGKENALYKQLSKDKWSVQYYSNFLNDSLLIVFREHNPPYYIDMYNVKYDTPIYLGSLKIDNDWQPITSWKNRIIFLNRDLLLKENKIELKLGYIRI
ncbi:hypothetical protein J7L68_06685 [bacterium]|nr:hypothetical protein [bacterium]